MPTSEMPKGVKQNQKIPSHGAGCRCRCCNGFYREYRQWVNGIADERERNLELRFLDQAIKDEHAKHVIKMAVQLVVPHNPKSQIKRHYDEVPDEPVDTTF